MSTNNNPNGLKIGDKVISVSTETKGTVIGFDSRGYPVVESEDWSFFSAGSNFVKQLEKKKYNVYYLPQAKVHVIYEASSFNDNVASSRPVTYIFIKQIEVELP